MVDRLPNTDPSIMARRTVVDIDTQVIKRRAFEIGSGVTGGTIRNRWQVVDEFTHTDYIVVAIRAQSGGINVARAMTKDAAGEGTRSVTNATILRGQHVAAVGWLPVRFSNITGVAPCLGAIGHDTAVIDECAGETVGTMAITAVGAGYRVAGYRGRLGGRVNAISFIVA